MTRSLHYRFGQVLSIVALTTMMPVAAASGQTAKIEGVVRSAATGDPIAGARVTVVGTNLSAATNSDGVYTITDVPAGKQTIRAHAIGFQPITVTDHEVSAGLPNTVNFSLEQSILRIEGVVVTGVSELASTLASGRAVKAGVDIDDIDQVQLLFRTHFDLAQFTEASRWCDESEQRFPDDYRSPLCKLWMLTTENSDPDIRSAWRLASEVRAHAPGSVKEYYVAESRTVVGGVIARAGLGDSANAVLTGARVDGSLDPSKTLLRLEAFMRVVAGQHDEALDLLEEYQRVNPDLSYEFGGKLHWFWRPLQDHPRFRALLAGGNQ